MSVSYPEPGISGFELGIVAAQVEALEPRRVYLEIGARMGGSFAFFGRRMEPGALLMAADWPGGEWGFQDSDRTLNNVADHLEKEGYETRLVFGDSHAAETLEVVRELLEGRAVDVLLIDGDHRPEGVAQDVRDYTPLVREGGLVIFHDCGYTWAAGCTDTGSDPKAVIDGVHRVFQEFAKDRRSMIVQESWGLGVVWK